MGSQSVTCYLAEVRFHLYPSQLKLVPVAFLPGGETNWALAPTAIGSLQQNQAFWGRLNVDGAED